MRPSGRFPSKRDRLLSFLVIGVPVVAKALAMMSIIIIIIIIIEQHGPLYMFLRTSNLQGQCRIYVLLKQKKTGSR